MAEILKPGLFGKTVPCDKLRNTFDVHNEQIISVAKSVDFVFFGDSITEQLDVHLYFGDLGFVVNRGIGGDNTEYLLMRMGADVCQLKPKNMVFLAGINDIIASSPNLWWRQPGKDKQTVISAIINNIEKIMNRCKQENINGYFASILPVDLCVPYNTFGLEEMVLTVNEGIKSLCAKYGMKYVDYYSSLVDESGVRIKDGLTYDGVHPNPKCYDIMAKKLRESL